MALAVAAALAMSPIAVADDPTYTITVTAGGV